jgi:DNA-binding transcriptional regulator YhcF (GntR family)
MSFKLVKKVIRSQQQTAAHKLVLIVIADHTNETKSGTAWPAVETIANYVGLKRRQVQRILRDLEQSGQIRVWKKNAMMGTNRYQIVSLNVSPMTSQRVTHDTPNVSPMTQRGVTHDTQVHKEQTKLNKVGGPAPSGLAVAASQIETINNSDPTAPPEVGGAPQCTKHTQIEIGCLTCYTWQHAQWRKEPMA